MFKRLKEEPDSMDLVVVMEATFYISSELQNLNTLIKVKIIINRKYNRYNPVELSPQQMDRNI